MVKKASPLFPALMYDSTLNGLPGAVVQEHPLLFIPQRVTSCREPIVSRAITKIIWTTATTLKTLPIIT